MGTKYKISMTDLDTQHNIAKLERDGFSREQIHKDMYKHTDGMTQQDRTALMKKLYDRRER
jgi:hypothetical protein